MLGAHVRHYEGGISGTSFAVWAPGARGVRVKADFNNWDGREHPMRQLGQSGVWELFVPGVGSGTQYKYVIFGADNEWREKADPMAFYTEVPPQTSSVVYQSGYQWGDDEWMAARPTAPVGVRADVGLRGAPGLVAPALRPDARLRRPRGPARGLRLGPGLHPRRADARHAAPLRRVVGLPRDVVLRSRLAASATPTASATWWTGCTRRASASSWTGCPATSPTDPWALARFDGTPLYEDPNPQRGWHQEWGSHIFNFGRHEVRNFLYANAAYWLEEFHADGLRVDGVASMLYLDYSREEGEWTPNIHGGRENLEAVQFLQEMNATVYRRTPGVVTIAEESTSWPGVTKPTDAGGLGFGFKWNMGWMHDTLAYMAHDPVHRAYHHHEMTFSMVYAYSENYMLPLSHDEVVHGKGSLLRKMPGDRWQQLANLRAYLAFMWAHPGKQLIFMGIELGQEAEWAEARELDWWLLDHPEHLGVALAHARPQPDVHRLPRPVGP